MDADEREWVKVAALADVPPGQAARIDVEGRDVAVFHLADGSIRAVADSCPHAAFPLHESDVRGHEVTCSLHHWVFSLDDGSCSFGARGVATYPCELRGEDIYLSPPRHDRGKQDKVLKAMRVCVATGVTKKLAMLVDKALDLEVPPDHIMQLAMAASPPWMLAIQRSLAVTLTAFPGIPRGDILLTAVRWAARSMSLPGTPPDRPVPPVLGPPSAQLLAEPSRHLRRRLVASLEKRDATEACTLGRAYVTAGHNPLYLAQDLVRAALESDPWLFPQALAMGQRAYHWRGDELRVVDEVLTALCVAGERADERRVEEARLDDGSPS